MKKYINYWLGIVLLAFISASCSEDDLSGQSIFEDDLQMEKNEFDHWLDANYLDPYNVEFKYRMEDVETDFGKNLVPIKYEQAVQLARIVKHAWFELYDEVAGIEFTRTYVPKMIHLVGSYSYNPNGTITIGPADSGMKVTLFGGNWLNPKDIPFLNEYYFKTMHHEFSHILHQNKDYPTEYRTLSEGHYSPSGWNNRHSMADYAPYGFVTAYGSSEPGEDIAEMTACFLTWSDEEWEKLKEGTKVDADGNPVEGGWEIIQHKLELMKKYMMTSYGIDMDKLRDANRRRCDELLRMNLDELP